MTFNQEVSYNTLACQKYFNSSIQDIGVSLRFVACRPVASIDEQETKTIDRKGYSNQQKHTN